MIRRFLLIAALVLFAQSAHAQTFVQSTVVASGNPTATISPTVTSGNMLLVTEYCYVQACTGNAVSDGVNTFTLVAHCNDNANGSTYIFEADNITGGTRTISMTSTSGNFIEGFVGEWSGMATSAFDKQACGSTTTSTASTTTTAQANELLIGLGSSGACGMTAGSGYTIRGTPGAPVAFCQFWESQNVTATGTYAATITSGSASKGFMIATFKAAGGGGAVATPGKRILL